MKCEYCGYDGDGFEEGEFGFWCPDCQGLLYKNGKEDYSQADIILEKPVSDHRPIIQKSRLKKQLSPLRYPGGKSKMIDQLLPYIKGKKYFVEAFCGGASFGLSLLESGMIEKLTWIRMCMHFGIRYAMKSTKNSLIRSENISQVENPIFCTRNECSKQAFQRLIVHSTFL